MVNLATGKCKPRKKLRFEVHLTEHCNLNCAGCNHFSPLANEKYIDTASYKNDCARINKLTDGNVEVIRLMGGEPLLHPYLITLLKISRDFFCGDTYIEIVTNGILLSEQSPEFWQTCKENNITIFISKYPIRLDLKKIEQLAKHFHVKIVYRDNIDKTSHWRAEPLDLTGSQDIKRNFCICYKGNNCIQLKDGKLFTCQQASYIDHFNTFFGTELEITEKDYISIYDHTIEEIFLFLSKPIPFCRYCVIDYGDKFDRQWEISRKSISEWTL
jgi:uncharacterized radical SAM superfamily Fe-S cluster-containing enzyme